MASRINVDITADDQSDGELVARLITANLSAHGFDDVTNNSSLLDDDKEDEILEAMRTLNPSIFNSEVVLEVSTFEETATISSDDAPGVLDEVPGSVDLPGADEFPDPETQLDEELDGEDD